MGWRNTFEPASRALASGGRRARPTRVKGSEWRPLHTTAQFWVVPRSLFRPEAGKPASGFFYSFFAEDKRLSKIKVNECKYRKYEQDNNILIQMKEIGHLPILNYFLGNELSSKGEYIVVDVKQIDVFMEYLKSIEGKRLYQKDRECIKEQFETIGVKLRYIGINTFNGALDDVYKELYTCRFYSQTLNNKPLIDKRRKLEDGSINPNRDKRYWILEQR